MIEIKEASPDDFWDFLGDNINTPTEIIDVLNELDKRGLNSKDANGVADFLISVMHKDNGVFSRKAYKYPWRKDLEKYIANALSSNVALAELFTLSDFEVDKSLKGAYICESFDNAYDLQVNTHDIVAALSPINVGKKPTVLQKIVQNSDTPHQVNLHHVQTFVNSELEESRWICGLPDTSIISLQHTAHFEIPLKMELDKKHPGKLKITFLWPFTGEVKVLNFQTTTKTGKARNLFNWHAVDRQEYDTALNKLDELNTES